MSVTFVEVWSLRYGIANPPRSVPAGVQMRLELEYEQARFERDPPLTEREMRTLEWGPRGSYARRASAR